MVGGWGGGGWLEKLEINQVQPAGLSLSTQFFIEFSIVAFVNPHFGFDSPGWFFQGKS